jgi:hypothetical protein
MRTTDNVQPALSPEGEIIMQRFLHVLRFSLQSGAYEHEACACSRDPGEKCGLEGFFDIDVNNNYDTCPYNDLKYYVI